MTSKEEAHFMKRFSLLIRSGMPLTSCLAIMASQARSARVRATLIGIQTEVENGRTLAACMEPYPRLFSRASVAVIRVAEATGSLSSSLEYLADELQKKSTLRSKLIGALAYPVLITILTGVLTAGLVLFIFPKILPLFSGLHVALPFPTRVVLAANDYLRRFGLATLVASLAVIGCVAILIRRNTAVRRISERCMLSAPFIGALAQAYALATLSRTLALLLTAGMPLKDALAASADVASFLSYRTELHSFSQAIETGEDLSEQLGNRVLFPSIVGHLVRVGESSGTLPETLVYLSDYFSNEAEEGMRTLTTLIEPILMIVMGSIVGFVAVSMIMPIYEITQHLHAN